MIDPEFWRRVPGIGRTDRNTIHGNKGTPSTIIEGVFAQDVFAAGDAATEPATVVQAIAGGREAAESIARYLKGEDVTEGRPLEFPESPQYPALPPLPREPRVKAAVLPVEQWGGFREVELGFSEEEALREASRCLNCGLCSECMECVTKWPAHAL